MFQPPNGPQPYYTPPQRPQPWFASTIFTLLMLVFCFPFGLALMWTFRSEWTARAKWTVTGVFAVIFVIIAVSPSPPQPPAAPIPSSPAPKPLPPTHVAVKKDAQDSAHDQKTDIGRQDADATSAEAAKGIGLTYDQVMNHLSDSYDMEKGDPSGGRLNFSGPSADPAGSIMQVLGEHDNVWTASITVIEATAENAGGQEAANTANIGNATRMLVFVKNVAPDWDGALKWVTATIRRARFHPGKHYSIVHGERKYMIMYVDVINTTLIQVSRADDNKD